MFYPGTACPGVLAVCLSVSLKIDWRKPMVKASQNRVLAVCVVVTAVALIALPTIANRVFGRAEEPAKTTATAHYSVVMTEGHNLLVTDNATNKIYFYTIDKDKPIGSPLKLRASVDLTKVGQEEIRITPHNVEK
jgi:hypothetical protein